MKTTIELFNQFAGGDSDGTVAARLGMERTTITVARNKGRFSPALCRKMAEALGLDGDYWEDIASAETLQEPARSRILEKIAACIVLAIFIGMGVSYAPEAQAMGFENHPLRQSFPPHAVFRVLWNAIPQIIGFPSHVLDVRVRVHVSPIAFLGWLSQPAFRWLAASSAGVCGFSR